jgi:hypothetical protein
MFHADKAMPQLTAFVFRLLQYAFHAGRKAGRRRLRAAVSDEFFYGVCELFVVGAQGGQCFFRQAFLIEHGQKQMFRANIVVLHPPCFHGGVTKQLIDIVTVCHNFPPY